MIMSSIFSGYSSNVKSYFTPSSSLYDDALKQIDALNNYIKPILKDIQETQSAAKLHKLITQLSTSVSLYPNVLVQQSLINIISVLNLLKRYWSAINIIPPVVMYSSIKAVLKIKK